MDKTQLPRPSGPPESPSGFIYACDSERATSRRLRNLVKSHPTPVPAVSIVPHKQVRPDHSSRPPRFMPISWQIPEYGHCNGLPAASIYGQGAQDGNYDDGDYDNGETAGDGRLPSGETAAMSGQRLPGRPDDSRRLSTINIYYRPEDERPVSPRTPSQSALQPSSSPPVGLTARPDLQRDQSSNLPSFPSSGPLSPSPYAPRSPSWHHTYAPGTSSPQHTHSPAQRTPELHHPRPNNLSRMYVPLGWTNSTNHAERFSSPGALSPSSPGAAAAAAAAATAADTANRIADIHDICLVATQRYIRAHVNNWRARGGVIDEQKKDPSHAIPTRRRVIGNSSRIYRRRHKLHSRHYAVTSAAAAAAVAAPGALPATVHSANNLGYQTRLPSLKTAVPISPWPARYSLQKERHLAFPQSPAGPPLAPIHHHSPQAVPPRHPHGDSAVGARLPSQHLHNGSLQAATGNNHPTATRHQEGCYSDSDDSDDDNDDGSDDSNSSSSSSQPSLPDTSDHRHHHYHYNHSYSASSFPATLSSTDSLLANTSAICDLVWRRAQHARLFELGAERQAARDMHSLLVWAETVVGRFAKWEEQVKGNQQQQQQREDGNNHNGDEKNDFIGRVLNVRVHRRGEAAEVEAADNNNNNNNKDGEAEWRTAARAGKKLCQFLRCDGALKAITDLEEASE
ncbi:hypothetical protein B0T24DRAFT_35955 [Lasiosphaeria ovina]|uniref:Uncharacterized protein n=1 Tax=Lasiosphaeria ovina TaxID=92902 RepID=A0AAE0NKK7_9PEZI|nr:hypothetical protein B0T24DRAFT_35955 [Lasiosphaeria ovina]